MSPQPPHLVSGGAQEVGAVDVAPVPVLGQLLGAEVGVRQRRLDERLVVGRPLYIGGKHAGLSVSPPLRARVSRVLGGQDGGLGRAAGGEGGVGGLEEGVLVNAASSRQRRWWERRPGRCATLRRLCSLMLPAAGSGSGGSGALAAVPQRPWMPAQVTQSMLLRRLAERRERRARAKGSPASSRGEGRAEREQNHRSPHGDLQLHRECRGPAVSRPSGPASCMEFKPWGTALQTHSCGIFGS